MKMYVVWHSPFDEGNRYITIYQSFEDARTDAINDMNGSSDVTRIYETGFGDTQFYRSDWIWQCEADYHTGELTEIYTREGDAS
jgi:hypothetical protein